MNRKLATSFGALKTNSLSLPVLHTCDPSVSIDKKFELPRMPATLSLTAFAMYDISSWSLLAFS